MPTLRGGVSQCSHRRCRADTVTLLRVNFDSVPQTGEAERRAIERALERLVGADAVPPVYRSRWLAASLRENAAPLDEALDPVYAGRPRSTRGATRA